MMFCWQVVKFTDCSWLCSSPTNTRIMSKSVRSFWAPYPHLIVLWGSCRFLQVMEMGFDHENPSVKSNSTQGFSAGVFSLQFWCAVSQHTFGWIFLLCLFPLSNCFTRWFVWCNKPDFTISVMKYFYSFNLFQSMPLSTSVFLYSFS